MHLKIINNILLILICTSCIETHVSSKSKSNTIMYYDFPVSTIHKIESLIKGKDIIGASINYDYHVSKSFLFIYFNSKGGPIKLFDNMEDYRIKRFKGDRFIKTKSLNIPIYSIEDSQFIKKVSQMFSPIKSHRYIILTLNEKGYVLDSGTMGK